MTKKRWLVLSTVILLAAVAALLLRSHMFNRAPEKLRFGVAMTPMSLLVFVAQEKGLFEKHGLDVSFKEYGAGVLAAAGLLEGEVDMATAIEFHLVLHNLEGRDLRTIASISRINDCELIARKDAGIASAAGLQGKRIATSSATVLEFFLEYFLAGHGVSLSTVTVENLKPGETVDALVSGSVDAMVGFSPYTFQARRKMGSSVLSWPLQERQFYYALILTTSGFLKSHPGTAGKFLSALLEAEAFVSEHRAEAQTVIMRRLGLDEAYTASVWAQQTYDVRLDQHLLRLMEDESRWLLKRSGGQGIPNYLGHIDWQPLENIEPDAVGLIH
ncbi:MAG: NrtA/SsuA/CpmA family ABC transporter substrate-binding protein [Syntrophales bacterium]|jgi:NitT/TauT family transport system substrate-binding protein|nr:NrtA/SsuA/CpmA family ABC transporter substrate-binding protein [Syntrophales bacterium]